MALSQHARSAKPTSNFDAISLYDSFAEEVLVLIPPPANQSLPRIDLSTKGLSTREAKPPVVWFEKSVQKYIDEGIQACEKNKDKLRQSYLPAPYAHCSLSSEADIVQASVLWLVHPVVKALEAEFPYVKCAAEVFLKGSRCDALITVGAQHLVVIEYKSRGNINRPDFLRGKINDSTVQNGTIIREQIAKGQKSAFQSNMGYNATCLSKQAAAYATQWETRHVVLFDWDTMFLWNFAGMHLTGSANSRANGISGKIVIGHAEWAYGTFVDSRRDYRRALLGFVMSSWRSKQKPQWKIGEPKPYQLSEVEKKRLQEEAERRRQQQPGTQQSANAQYRR